MSGSKPRPDLSFDILKKQNDPVLKLVYGAPPSETFDEIPVPLSPTSSIERAGREVLKQQQKGVRCNIDPTTEPLEVYKDFVIQMMQKQKREKKLEKLIKAKEEMEENETVAEKWWYRTDTVVKAMKDLLSLPFRDDADRYLYEIRLHDAIGLVIHEMERKFQLSRFQCESKKHRMRMMMYFVVEVRKLREKMIREAVRGRRLPFDEIPQELKEEFADLEVKPPSAEGEAREAIRDIRKPNGGRFGDFVFQREMSHSERYIPRDYKININVKQLAEGRPSKKKTKAFLSRTQQCLDVEMSRPASRAVTQPVSPRPMTELKRRNAYEFRHRPVVSLTQPVTPSKRSPREMETRAAQREKIRKEMTKEEQMQMLWEMGDPLPGRKVEDGKGPLGMLRSLGHMTIDYKMETIGDEILPFTPSEKQKPAKKETNLWKPIPFDETPEDNKTEVATPEVAQSAPVVGNYGEISRCSDSLRFLMDQRIDTCNLTQGDTLHAQLHEIWDNLGFKTSQKIKMILRYSESPEKSGRLSEAIGYWQRAYMSFQKYRDVYKATKEFLTFEHVVPGKLESGYDERIRELKIYEWQIQDIAEEIQRLYGDVVILRGRPADEFLRVKRAKLERLRSQE